MAGAEIIGAAIGVLLLVLVGYIMVGSTLSSAEIVASAQKDLTMQNEARLRTDIAVFSPYPPNGAGTFNFSLNNTGNEIIGDFSHMDIFSSNSSSSEYQRYIYDRSGISGQGTWTIIKFDRDVIHPSMLDPGEAMWICATYAGDKPKWVLVTTGNGVSASRNI
jgi:flagellar protein FlaF